MNVWMDSLLLLNCLLLFGLLLIPLVVVRDARRKDFSASAILMWIAVSVFLFPLGFFLYILLTRHREVASPQQISSNPSIRRES